MTKRFKKGDVIKPIKALETRNGEPYYEHFIVHGYDRLGSLVYIPRRDSDYKIKGDPEFFVSAGYRVDTPLAERVRIRQAQKNGDA